MASAPRRDGILLAWPICLLSLIRDRLTTIAGQVAGGLAAMLESLMGWKNIGD